VGLGLDWKKEAYTKKGGGGSKKLEERGKRIPCPSYTAETLTASEEGANITQDSLLSFSIRDSIWHTGGSLRKKKKYS